MGNAKRHLNNGYDLLDSIKFELKGSDIDRLAMARQEFRQAFAALEKAQKAAESEKIAQAQDEVKRDG